jgi:hypothetical protein
MQVDLELAEEAQVAAIEHLEASVTAVGQNKLSQLDTGPLKTARRASFVVVVGERGADGFNVVPEHFSPGAGRRRTRPVRRRELQVCRRHPRGRASRMARIISSDREKAE